MNTVLSRANSLFAFSLSVMAALTFACFITTAFKERSVPVSIAISRVVLKNVDDFTGPRERSDLGFVTFDITADLQSIFDWNVKQLFVYLSVEYSTKKNALNQVVLWDKVILRGDNPRLFLKDMKSKYFFFDDGNGLKGNKNVTFTLSWNVVPNAGILPLVTGSGHVSVPFPDTYETTKNFTCLMTFSLSLGFDQSSVANERILAVKVYDGVTTPLQAVILGSFTNLSWTKEEVAKTKLRPRKIFSVYTTPSHLCKADAIMYVPLRASRRK